MGTKIVLKGQKLTENLSAPKLPEIDAIESAGSLMLVEPMHPAGAWAAGVPAHNTTLTNLLAATAQPLVGAAGLHPTLAYSGMAGTQGKIERTGKGGLHAIYSNTHATNISTSSSCYARILAGTEMRTYLAANYGHRIFISLWTNVTRQTPLGKQSNAAFLLSNTNASTGNFKSWAHAVGIGGSAESEGYRFSRYDTNGTGGPKLLNVARESYTGTIPPNAAGTYADLFSLGNSGTVNSYLTAKEASPSLIFYRAYWEDLTVSGRSYAEVDAIDTELYTKHVLTPGGRYYADTFTDPATIA